VRVSLPAEVVPNSEPEDRNRYAVGALMISPSPGGTEIRRDSLDSQQDPLVVDSPEQSQGKEAAVTGGIVRIREAKRKDTAG
jgi:hypothetical protein